MAFDPNNPNWCTFSRDKTKALGIFPNQLWHNAETCAGVLVVIKPKNYEEYPLSKAGLDYLVAAHQEQRIPAGEVALVSRHNGKLSVVAAKPVTTVAAALTGIPPRDGALGPYWWVRADLTPDGPRVLNAEDTPF
jgi:hypothetical protein